MRIAYLECFAGISGDMFLGSLVDAGVDTSVLQTAAAALNLGVTIRVEKVDRSGIWSSKVHVMEGGKLADSPASSITAFPQQVSREDAAYQAQPQTQHQHKLGHAHSHEHGPHEHTSDPSHTHGHEHDHAHGRSLSVIRGMIQASSLSDAVKRTAVRAFELLGASEARIHNVPVDDIHFHEVGAVDAIVDIVAASAGIHALGADAWFCSPINVGGGMVDCAHGRFPVPAPATADLLRGMPTYAANLKIELVTPTGAALLRTLVQEKGLSFSQQPAMRIEKIGYGAGTRNPKQHPNVLRLSVGEAVEAGLETRHDDSISSARAASQTVTVLETALDDLSPQVLAHVAETALLQGALDVMLTPVIMKKGRPGTLITLLCEPQDSPLFEQLLLRETSTLGLRVRQDQRTVLQREHVTVNTPYGAIRLKLGKLAAEVLNAHPEFEDCRTAAAAHQVPVKEVQQSALNAYHSTRSGADHA